MQGFVCGSLFSTIEACGCPVELSNGCLACVENCDGCLCESFTGVAKKRDDGVCVGCGRREVNAGERVFKVWYLGWCPGTHPDVVMRGMCDGGGVGKVSYGIEALVLAREGIEFGHERGDMADHFSANCSDRWV